MCATIEALYLEAFKINAFAALCGDRSVVMQGADSLLPLGWHQLFTHATDPWLRAGADGHPQQRPAQVPVHFDKRMWAASEVRVDQPIELAGPISVERDEPEVSLKQGRSGDLAFSREVLRWRRNSRLILEEVKTVVYKHGISGHAVPPARRPQPAMPVPSVRQPLLLDEVALFKYSALLGVAHRIHFDYPYATQVEGYPGLLIHGPLLIQLLLNLARDNRLGWSCGAYQARALAPNFLGMSLHLNLARQHEHVLLWVSDDEDQPTLIITLHA